MDNLGIKDPLPIYSFSSGHSENKIGFNSVCEWQVWFKHFKTSMGRIFGGWWILMYKMIHRYKLGWYLLISRESTAAHFFLHINLFSFLFCLNLPSQGQTLYRLCLPLERYTRFFLRLQGTYILYKYRNGCVVVKKYCPLDQTIMGWIHVTVYTRL